MTICRLAVLWAVLILNATASGQDDAFKKPLSEFVTGQARNVLAKKSFTIDQPAFVGTIAPIDPQKTLQVNIQNLKLNKDQLSVLAIIKASYELNGLLKGRDGSEKVIVRVMVDLSVDGTATLVSKQGKFFLKPKIGNMEIKTIQIESAPKGVVVDRGNVEQSLKDEFKKNKAKISEYLNGVLPEQELK